MKRPLIVIASIGLLITSFSGQANAASPKAGASCTKLGQTITSASIKFTCIKSGSKNVWNKGVAVKKNGEQAQAPIIAQAPAPAPAPKVEPKIFKALIPITLPVSQNGPITFQNIVSNFAQIPDVAFKNSQDVLAKNSSPNITLDLFIGPNTKLDFPGGEAQIRDNLSTTAKLWGGFSQSEVLTIVAYNAKDEPWAEQKMKDVGNKRNYSKIYDYSIAIKGNCQETIAPGKFSGEITSCGGSNAGAVVDSPDSYIEFGMTGNSTDLYFTSGALIGHEYTHTVQAANWINDPKCKNIDGKYCFRSGMSNQGFSPCWLFEGLPNSAGRLAVSTSLSEYMSNRQGLPYGWGPTTVTDYKENSLRNYLVNQNPSTCYENGEIYKLGYSIGAFATEALIAIGGPQAVMSLYSLGAEGQEFTTAFKNVYGISWSEAASILAKVLAAEYETFGTPPK